MLILKTWLFFYNTKRINLLETHVLFLCFIYIYFLNSFYRRVMKKIHAAGTYPWLGKPLDFLSLCVSDEVVVQNHIRLQAQHLTSYWQ